MPSFYLLAIIIKYFIIIIPFIILIFLIKFIKRRKYRNYRVLILPFSITFSVTFLLSAYLIISDIVVYNKSLKEYSGRYKLLNLDCEECSDCEVELHIDKKYDILKKNKIIGNGSWDLEMNLDAGGLYHISLDGGYSAEVDYRVIDNITRINCCLEGCKENLAAEFYGKVVNIMQVRKNYGFKTIFMLSANGDTLKYSDKYYAHPGIFDKIQIGDYLSKIKNKMEFIVIHPKGDTTLLKYETPDCEKICNFK